MIDEPAVASSTTLAPAATASSPVPYALLWLVGALAVGRVSRSASRGRYRAARTAARARSWDRLVDERVDVRVSAAVRAPAVAGLVRLVVLVPVESASWSDDRSARAAPRVRARSARMSGSSRRRDRVQSALVQSAGVAGGVAPAAPSASSRRTRRCSRAGVRVELCGGSAAIAARGAARDGRARGEALVRRIEAIVGARCPRRSWPRCGSAWRRARRRPRWRSRART